MKKCPKCGKENSNNTQFCPACGETLIKNKKTKRKEKNLLLIVGVIAVLSFLAGVTGTFFVLNRFTHTEKRDSGDTSLVSETASDTDSSSETIIESEETEDNSEDIERRSDEPMVLTDSWTDIVEASNNGTYKEKYRIGDTKELDLGTEGVVRMKLVAMDADELADGSGYASMTWIAEDLLNTEHVMNTEDTIEGGWPESDLREWLNTSIYEMVPDEVRTEIKEVKKYSMSYIPVRETVSSSDTLWIPSCREIFGAEGGREDKGAEYSYAFPDENSWKRYHINSTQETYWFLRSANLLNNGTKGFIEGTMGSPVHTPYRLYQCFSSNEKLGIVIGFCL